MSAEERIEQAINREIAGGVAISNPGTGVFTVAPRSMGEVMEFSKLMAISGVAIRPQFRGNPGACLAITIQAMKWGADPFAVANKAYVVRNKAGEETLAYEAQLIHAIVNSSPVLARRLRPIYEGEGNNRRCRIVGYVRGESEPLEYESPPIGRIAVKNSPLWQGDPDQQLFYYATRAWARRHVPEVLLGIYAPDDFGGETIEMEAIPEPRREDFVAINEKPEPVDTRPEYAVIDLDGAETIFREPARTETALSVLMAEAAKLGLVRLEGWWSDNLGTIERLGSPGSLVGEYDDTRLRLIAERAEAARHAPSADPPDRGATEPARETAPRPIGRPNPNRPTVRQPPPRLPHHKPVTISPARCRPNRGCRTTVSRRARNISRR